jgi:septal ring factor EnvC (AmiA/AmiB activator)
MWTFGRHFKLGGWALASVCAMACSPLFAQGGEQSELENERATLGRQISRAQQLITESEAQQKESERGLSLIRREIELRDALLGTLGSEKRAVRAALTVEVAGLDSLELRLAKLRAEFGATLRLSQRLGARDDFWAFLLDAESFSMALRRWAWVRSYTTRRIAQAEELEATLARIEGRHAALAEQQGELDDIGRKLQNERRSQREKKRRADQVLTALQQEESGHRKDVERAQSKQRELDQAIAAIIEAARLAARSGSAFGATPEGQATAAAFTSNKGALPWPVSQGTLVGKFGTHPHPSFPGIQIENNGIDIATSDGAPVHAVFKGRVSTVVEFPGLGWLIMIDHGSHRSVYANLRAPEVAAGELVETGALLGAVLDLGSGKGAVAHLEIWDASGSSPDNPLGWIAR